MAQNYRLSLQPNNDYLQIIMRKTKFYDPHWTQAFHQHIITNKNSQKPLSL